MVQYCRLVFIKTVYFTTIKTAITMKGLILFRRTTKSEETIKLRFRLRKVIVCYKSEIKAEIKNLAKFEDDGELSPKISTTTN